MGKRSWERGVGREEEKEEGGRRKRRGRKERERGLQCHDGFDTRLSHINLEDYARNIQPCLPQMAKHITVQWFSAVTNTVMD